MLDTDLTSISTYGWFAEPTIEGRLLPVSTLGWWYIEEDIRDVFNILLNVHNLLHLDLSR